MNFVCACFFLAFCTKLNFYSIFHCRVVHSTTLRSDFRGLNSRGADFSRGGFLRGGLRGSTTLHGDSSTRLFAATHRLDDSARRLDDSTTLRSDSTTQRLFAATRRLDDSSRRLIDSTTLRGDSTTRRLFAATRRLDDSSRRLDDSTTLRSDSTTRRLFAATHRLDDSSRRLDDSSQRLLYAADFAAEVCAADFKWGIFVAYFPVDGICSAVSWMPWIQDTHNMCHLPSRLFLADFEAHFYSGLPAYYFF